MGEVTADTVAYFALASTAVVVLVARFMHRHRRASRVRRVERAALEAALDDPAFSPEAVRRSATRLFMDVQDARDRRDVAALARWLAPGLHDQWRRRISAIDGKGWFERAEVLEVRSVEYLGLVNREGEEDDRVSVRIRALMRDYVMNADGELIDVYADIDSFIPQYAQEKGLPHELKSEDLKEIVDRVEIWTLGKRADGEGWVLVSVEGDDEGAHVLDAEIVAVPWADERRIADESTLEVAALDRLPPGMSTAEVADLDYLGDARTAALDLSLVDGRWAPDALEASVRNAVAAWAEAMDGADRDLLDVATPAAAEELLYSVDEHGRQRRFIRGPRVRHLTIAALEPAAEPPEMTVDVEVTGRHFERDVTTGAIVYGDPVIAITTAERWTMALSGPGERPWQIVHATTGVLRQTRAARAGRVLDSLRQFWPWVHSGTRGGSAALLLALGAMLTTAPAALAADGGSSADLVEALGYVVTGTLAVIAALLYRRRRKARERRVELAAATAADDDPSFHPDAVRAGAADMFLAVKDAQDRGDRVALAELLAPGLLDDWRRQLDELDRKGWRRRAEVLDMKSVEYLGLVNRQGEGEDRVIVRIRATVLDCLQTRDGVALERDGSERDLFDALDHYTSSGLLVGLLKHGHNHPDIVELAEFWTFAKCAHGRGWIVASVEDDTEGRHVLDAEIVASPWDDDRRMRDASLLEVAALDQLPEGMSPAEVVDLDYVGDARAAALDLSIVDGRWAPDVLETSVRRAVDAWAEAVDGADRDLLDVATAEAAQALLHPGDPSRGTRLVIRGPRVRHLTIAALDAASNPPTMTIEVEVIGRRYVQERASGHVVRGVRWLAVTTAQRWTMAPLGPDDRPWRIVDVEEASPRNTPSALAHRALGIVRQFWTAAFHVFAR